MAWKGASTSTCVDVDLDEFEPEQLLQGLIDAGMITGGEAEAIVARAKASNGGHVLTHGNQTGDELERAWVALRRHNKADALYYIERYLGREWFGVLQ